MLVFIAETFAACLLLTAGCLLSTRKLTDNLELAKIKLAGVDCILFCHSKRFIIPGTEDLTDAYRDCKFHIKVSCFGMLIGLPCCLIAGLLAMFLK